MRELETDLDSVLKWHIEKILTKHGGNKMTAAFELKISRSTLYRYINKWHIWVPNQQKESENADALEPAEIE